MATNSKLKVLFVCAEVAPFSSVGGLSQVAYFLTKSLQKLNVDVRIFSIKYGQNDQKKYPLKKITELAVKTNEAPGNPGTPDTLNCDVFLYQKNKDSVPVYLIENEEYFSKRANVYGYSDDHIRFGLLSKAALEFIRTSKDFIPDVIHTNDWHTGYLIDLLRHDPVYAQNPHMKKIATLLSVHNIYQGVFNFSQASEMDFDDGKSPLASFFSERFYKQNPLKRGIMYADIVNTVSENYVHELMTEEYGGGLHNLFKELRGKVYGVLNGLDTADFNPITDKIIKKNYSKTNLANRSVNKTDLQQQFGLEKNPHIPLLGFVGRLDSQKGIDLVKREIEFIVDELNAQFIIVGPSGSEDAEFFSNLEKKYPGKVGTHLMFDSILPRKVFSGADVILMPSRYEPGGIVAIEALRYGCVPIVRATGGLADSVVNYDPQKNVGYGFSFKQFTAESFLTAVVRATEVYKNRAEWNRIVRRAMEIDFSWPKSAEKYLDLYDRAIEFRKEALEPNPSPAFRPLYS